MTLVADFLDGATAATAGAEVARGGANLSADVTQAIALRLSAVLADTPGGLGAEAAGAAQAQAHVGPLRSREAPIPSAAPHGAVALMTSSAPRISYLYLPLGATAESVRLSDAQSGASTVVAMPPNGLLVFRSELSAEIVGTRPAAFIHLAVPHA